TLANVFLALDNDLEIIPVLNKIDLPSADPEAVKKDIEEAIGLPCSDAVSVSAKTGVNVGAVLEQIIAKIPPPGGKADAPLRALIVDSWYDSYQGVVVLFRIMEGTMRHGQRIRMMYNNAEFEVIRLGAFSPGPKDFPEFGPGEAGFFCANIKTLTEARVGDTVTSADNPATEPLPGFKEVKPMVFCGLYPVDAAEYEVLKSALEKLRLNDAAFTYEPETSQALGFGFRCGFLGLLHMEIIQERLEREFGANLIATAPSVIYKVETTAGATIPVDNPSKLPKPQEIAALYEPFARLEIHTPNEYVGGVFKLCEEKRGIQKDVRYLTATRVVITYELPFAEIVYDFFDR
ncbi:MAG: EF-Tu/IF-2/RF-3 family GTPase, partial [Acidobacteriota bacterium]